MYTVFVYEGVTRRDSDGKVVAPVSDTTDPDYVDWLAWLAAGNSPAEDLTVPPAPPVRTMTKLAFRRRFTLEERIACDSAPDNPQLPESARAALRTMATDLALAEEVDLDDADVIAGVQLLAQLGLVSEARAAEILS